MKKFHGLRTGAILLVAGIAIALIGFVASGLDPHAYTPYSERWYSAFHLGN